MELFRHCAESRRFVRFLIENWLYLNQNMCLNLLFDSIKEQVQLCQLYLFITAHSKYNMNII